MENEHLDYNDLQYQYVGFKRSIAGSPNNSYADRLTTEPIEERELDHNELAELVYLRRHLTCRIEITGETIDQTETGGVESAVTFEINSGEGEWLNSDQRDPEFVEENNRNLDMENMQLQVPFNELTDQGGGGGGSAGTSTERREVMLAGPNGMFHHGPVIDANDTLDFRYEVDKQNCIYNVVTKAYYILGWRLHEIENARPEFGIPL